MRESFKRDVKEIRDDVSDLNFKLFIITAVTHMGATGLAILSMSMFFNNHPIESVVIPAIGSGLCGGVSLLGTLGIFGGVNYFTDEVCNLLENNEIVIDEESPLIQYDCRANSL